MSREAVIRHIVELERKGESLTEDAVLQEAPDVHRVACQQFGSWETALKYAGVRVQANGYLSRERVLSEIRALCRRGYTLKASENQRRNRPLYDAARRYFGPWRQALQAAGIDVRHADLRRVKRRRLSRQKTLDALREWLAAGHALDGAQITRENRALATAVKRVFGSWRRALVALGLTADSPSVALCRKWSAQRVIECIQLRQQEGKPINCAAILRDAHALASAGRRYFGNWGNALAAAGVKAERRSHGGRDDSRD